MLLTGFGSIGAVAQVFAHTITASAGANGSIAPDGAVTVEDGADQSFTITPEVNYHVADVLVDGLSVGAVTSHTFTNVTADHTISATFAIDTYTITASAGAHGSIAPSGTVPVASGAAQTFTITSDANYHVADVLVDGISVGAVTSYAFTNVTADHTISATFAINTRTITASAGPNGSITPNGAVAVAYGGFQTFAITPDANYHIADVKADGVSVGAVSSYTFTNVTTDHTISATFAINTYVITASAGANGSIAPAGAVTVGQGTDQLFTITANPDYRVADVVVDGVSVGAMTSYTFVNVTAPHTISASFALAAFTITATAESGGSIDPSGDVGVAFDSDRTFTITPGTCHHIVDVEVDQVSVGPLASYTFENVSAHHTITAIFAPDVYTVETYAGTGGSITSSVPQQPAPDLEIAGPTLYVDGSNPVCSNTGPGTSLQPFCSISAAVSQGGPGTTILVMPATYREQVNVPVSGAAGSPFVIKATGPGVIVEGSDDFSSPPLWVLHSGNVWLAASVNWTPAQVFLDGVRLTVSTAATTALPSNSFRYVSGSGLYVNADGGNPGSHQLLVSRRTHGFRLQGRSYVTIEGFNVTRSNEKAIYAQSSSSNIEIVGNTATFAGSNGIALNTVTNCAVRGNVVADNGDHGILLSSANFCVVSDNATFRNARPQVRAANGIHLLGSSNNQVLRNNIHHNQDTGHHFSSGSNNNLSIQNLSWNNGDHGYDHLGSTGNVHIGNVAFGNTKDGFSFEGGSSNGRVYDCISVENGLTTSSYDLHVDPTSMSGFSSNSNVLWKSTAGSVVRWGSTNYTSVAAYSAVSSQDSRTLQQNPLFANPALENFHLQPGSPAIDNADASMAEWPATDYAGVARVDDPTIANQGLGPISYGDRGAYEYQPQGQTVSAVCNSDITFSIVPNPGYHSTGVRVDGVMIGAVSTYTFENIRADHTLQATFAINTAAVSSPLRFDARPLAEGIQVRWEFDSSAQGAEFVLERGPALSGPWTVVAGERRIEGQLTTVIDRISGPETVHWYRLRVREPDAPDAFFGPVEVRTTELITESLLTEVHPNPTRGKLAVAFSVAREGGVRLIITDVQGRRVSTLADGSLRAGRHRAQWNGLTESGSKAPAGIYFVVYDVVGRRTTKRVSLTP